MATPARNLILENIETTLEGIATTAGYKTDVRTVERVAKDWATTGDRLMPWLGYRPAKERATHEGFDRMRCVLEIDIVGHVKSSTDSDRSDKLSDLIDDVVAALNADHTRNDNAVSTFVREYETDEGDPDTMDSRGGTGSFVMRVEVLYFRTTGST